MPATGLLDGLLIIGLAIVAFLSAFGLHVVIWRRADRVPGASTLVLLLVSVIVAEGAVVAGLIGLEVLELSLTAVVAAVLLALQAAACYVLSYPAMQAESPSLRMAELIRAAGPQGVSPTQLYLDLREPTLVDERIEDLIRDGLAVERDGDIRCSAKGTAIARAFAWWKIVLGEPKGG